MFESNNVNMFYNFVLHDTLREARGYRYLTISVFRRLSEGPASLLTTTTVCHLRKSVGFVFAEFVVFLDFCT